ncbi:MAG: type III pantothenate kinase [Methylococcaceae bacterium]
MTAYKPARLLVDIGNSRLKWAWSFGTELEAGPAFSSDITTLADDLKRFWGDRPSPPAEVYLANVAGADRAAVLSDWLMAQWGLVPRLVRSEPHRCGVVNGYDQPQQLGVDRWVALVGLQAYYGGPACVVDCGTAITLDMLDENGRHRGGLIAPGHQTMIRALLTQTAGIALTDYPAGAELLGRSTTAAVAGGVFLACAGLIEKAVAHLNCNGSPLRLVLTGGDAAEIGGHLSIPFLRDELLVLKGLLTIADSDFP